MFFNSIKEINRLISKGISNIYLKAAIEKNWRSQNFDFPSLENSFSHQFLRSSNSLNFKTSCYYLKMRCPGAKLCVAFLLS